ncbi:MAG TPA: MFS transporter, partial [Burkholderiales bacterium]|nr:MFS transporter [Burkholderiales bacterium]
MNESSMIAANVVKRFNRARLVVYGVLAVSYMLVFFHRIAPATLAADLMRDFGMSGAALGSLAAMYFYIYAAMQIPAGVLADTLGARVIASVGALVAGAGSVLFGLATTFGTAAAGRFLVGLGVSVVFIGLMRANTEWWSERRYGFISGLTVSLGNFGALLAAAPLAALLTVASWRTIFMLIGVVSVAVGILTWIFVRDRPEELGFPSPREMEGQSAHAPRSQHWGRDLVEVLRTRAIWPGFFVNFGVPGSALAVGGLWGVPLLMNVHGLTRAEASLYITLTIISL